MEQSPADSGANATGRPLCVLLLDENPDGREAVAQELRDVFPAVDVTDAPDRDALTLAASNHTYDVLVTDHLLTWASGDDILRISKKHAPACPVIMFTACGSEDIAVAAMKSGFDDYVVRDDRGLSLLSDAVQSGINRQATGADSPMVEPDAQMQLEELRSVLAGARCLVWHADVRDTSPLRDASALEWAGWEIDEAAAQRFLPLDMSHTPRYMDAFYQSGAEEGRERADAVAARALREGAEGYSQEMLRVDKEGRTRWIQEQVTIRPIGPSHWILVGVCVDITDRRQVEDALRQSEEQRGMLLRQVLGVQEADRARIARELHEEVGQAIASLAVALRVSDTETTLEELKQRVAEVRESAVELTEDVRRLATEMRPRTLEDMGFGPAMERHARELAARWGFELSYYLSNPDHRRLHEDLEVILYRVTHEVLMNAAQHARAENVEVIARYYDDSITVMIQDDGVGFDAEALLQGPVEDRFGMFAMQERMRMVGGSISFESLPDEGTVVFVDAPLPPR